MFSLETDKLLAEMRAQARARDEHLDGARVLMERYPGQWYSTGGVLNEDQEFDPENAAFEYISYTMSQLVWANPRWRVTTRRPRAQQMVAEAMQWMMNRWSADSDLKTVLEDLAVDYCFAWAIAHVSPQKRPDSYEAEDPIFWPQLSRISPFDFGFDHRAPTWRRARMLWHRYRYDKDDLIELARADRELPREQREGWNVKAIEQMNTTSPAASWLGTHQKKKPNTTTEVDEPDREEIEAVDIFLPGHRLPNKPGPEEGFNGTILTLGVSGSTTETSGAVMLREPRPFFGPRWGPYTVIGAYIVSDSPYPLGLLTAVGGHIEEANRVAKAVSRQVRAYKRLVVCSSLDTTMATKLKDGKNDHVYQSSGANLEAMFNEAEIGGTTPGNVAAELRAIQKRDRAMGFAENQRGITTGDTATDVTYANEAAQGRQGNVKGRFQDGIRRAGKTVAWYGYHMDEIVTPLGPEATEAFGLEDDEEAWFVGGSFEDGTGTTFDDLGLEIEPGSTERPNEAALARQGELLIQLVQMAQAFPMLAQMGADVKGLIDAIGDAYGYPRLSRLFPGIESVDLASIQPAEAEPRMARDVGLAGLFKSFAPKGMAGPASSPAPTDFAKAS